MRSALADAAGPVPITVSVGVASVRASASSPDVLIRRADDALYRAKAQGRNRVCTARPASPVRSIA
jgi:two-component system cell cycle response regulator